MSFKTILIACDAGKAATSRITLAAELATRSGGHLVGLYVVPPLQDFLVVANTSFDMEYFRRECLAKINADGAAAAATFYELTTGNRSTSEWRVVDFAHDAVVALARTADLVVVGQTNSEAPMVNVAADLPALLALNSGKAVLVVPWRGVSAATAKTVLLCWKEGREAARAATAALPFLQAAERVIMLTIEDTSDSGAPALSGAQAVAWLARHGVKATLRHQNGCDSNAGPLILAAARQVGADLIVMGAYGHSRLRELMLGGASRSVLAEMSVPVLLAH